VIQTLLRPLPIQIITLTHHIVPLDIATNLNRLDHYSDPSQRMQLRLQRGLHKDPSVLLSDVSVASSQE
jgi:hypothetical protein